MVDIEHANAYCEVLEILKNIEKEDYLKIPKEKIEIFKEYSNKKYYFKFNPNKTLDEQNVSTIARIIIGILFRDYIATESQRKKIVDYQKEVKKVIEEEKKEKYSYENLFKNNKVAEYLDDEKNNHNEIITYK